MEKILKNIHWVIILWAGFNLVKYYLEVDDKINAIKINVTSEQEKIVKAEKTKRDIAKFAQEISEAKGKIEKVAEEIEKTQQQLPGEISDTENISFLRKIAEDVNIKISTIVPDRETEKGFYFSKKYKFNAKATYLQFLVMFEKISEYKRLLTIGEVTFKKLDQPQRGKYQLIDGEFLLEVYRYNAGFKEDRGFAAIENELKTQNVVVPRKIKSRAKKDKEEE